MHNHHKKISASQLMYSWISSKLITPSQKQSLENFILSQYLGKKLPLFLGILIAVGAFMASFSFLGFFYISKIIYHPSELVWGLIFVGLALFFSKLSGDKLDIVRHSFVTQASLCTMLIGKAVFVIGFSKFVEMPWEETRYGVTLGALLITAVTYAFYPITFDRFFSTLACLILLLDCILEKSFLNLPINTALNLLFSMQFIIAAILFIYKKINQNFIPIAYAIACSLCISIISIETYTLIQNKDLTFNPIVINILLTISLIALIAWFAGSFKKLRSEPLLVASLGTLLLGIISPPGIILSLCLIIFGYKEHKNPLILLGIFFMPIFIFHYFYSLNVSLLEKSGILIGSGLVLLAGRAYLALRKLDHEA